MSKCIVNHLQPYTFLSATGDIKWRMTNDYVFRIIFQENTVALTGLTCSLLHLSESDINSVIVTNPIRLGDAISDKEFRMDVRVILNNSMILDLEMQISDNHDWPPRSLCYLSRDYDSLEHGQLYSEVDPVHQFAFLDYTLFKQRPKFYATYRMMDEEDHQIYSDSFAISVIDMKNIHLATATDCHYNIDKWVRLFKASSWEEVRMTTQGNIAMASAAESLYLANADYNIIKVARERNDFLREQTIKNQRLEEQAKALAEKDATIAEMKAEIDRLKAKENNSDK